MNNLIIKKCTFININDHKIDELLFAAKNRQDLNGRRNEDVPFSKLNCNAFYF